MKISLEVNGSRAQTDRCRTCEEPFWTRSGKILPSGHPLPDASYGFAVRARLLL